MLKSSKIDFLSELIDDIYGTPEELAEYLDLAVEMLFYLEEETFERKDIQNVVGAIRGITNALREYGPNVNFETQLLFLSRDFMTYFWPWNHNHIRINCCY